MPSPTRKSKEINPMLLRTLNPALFQSPQTPKKSIRKTRVRKSVIFRIVNSVNRTEVTPSKENHYHKKNILNAMNNRLNDKKETIPITRHKIAMIKSGSLWFIITIGSSCFIAMASK